MVLQPLAHIGDLAGSQWSTAHTALLVCSIAVGITLVLEHNYVKHGRMQFGDLRKPAAVAVALAFGAVLVPAPSSAQDSTQPVGLPDIISDPPFIWFNKNVKTADGETVRVMSFDGYIHNIGTGSLDLYGNPQLVDGMKQRVYDGESWDEVGSPTVKFETDDGHNHFHLMEVIDYQLWNESRTDIIGPAQKVGFCLIDTEQIEENFEPFYDIEDSNYCGVDSPDATELSMGITPGWRDTYASNVTFQWVNISDVLPGRYWITAITDPKNEILESNEDNNGIVFSMNKFAVDGYNARQLEPQRAGQVITLKADAYGIVGARAFVIGEAPSNGSLDVPTGADVLVDEVRYTPDPGFVGTDTFTYYAHDTSNGFPYTPHEVEVTVEVAAGDSSEVESTSGIDSDNASSDTEITIERAAELTIHQPATIEVTLGGVEPADDVRWFGMNMAPGLVVDAATGQISGVPTLPGEFAGTVIAVASGEFITGDVTITVADADVPELQPTNNFATTQTRRLAMYLGTGTSGSTYEGSGMPAGTEINSALPILGGTPEEIGDFTIEVRELVDDNVVNTIEFTWTVKPSIHPAFPL